MKAPMVDDPHAIRKIIGGILHKEGSEALEAADEEEAPDLLKNPESGKADLTTIDWNMSVMNGLELMVNIQAGKNLRDITLMMVTTGSEHSRIIRALAAGVHEYLIKPLTQEAISEELLLLGLGSWRAF